MLEPPASPPPRPFPEVAAERLAALLERRGVSRGTLGAAGVALAGLAAVLFALHHPGLAACLGLLGLLASELALRPPPSGLARALALPVDLLVTGGIVAGSATGEAPAPGLVLLGLIVMVLMAWLPELKRIATPDRLAADGGVWRRPERLVVLLLGALLGRLLPALLLVAAVGGIDAWLRLGLLDETGPRGPAFLRPLVGEGGRLVPAARWGTLAIALLVLLVLPRAEGWTF